MWVNDVVAAHPHLESRALHRPGRWTDERVAQHHAIVDEVYERHKSVPTDRQAILSGGLAGAGKTTVLVGHAQVDMSQYMLIGADEMKDELAVRGMIPEIPGHDLTPLERSTLIQIESSYLADMLAERAFADGRNVVIDATMGDQGVVQRRLARLHEKGYTVRGVFVDVPVEVSRDRVAARYAQGMRDYREGRGHGGRPISLDYIMGQQGPGGMTKNRLVFDELSGQGAFSGGWALYDNSGSAPRLVRES
jgi:predicted kinase